eukprot:scaffold126701_cov47-Prasinocladus_malaysianus.AAC.1
MASFGGEGHTAILYTNATKRDRIRQFEERMPTYKILIDQPSAFGAIGDVYNFSLAPSLTLGCGAKGGSSVSTNVGPEHLLNLGHVNPLLEVLKAKGMATRVFDAVTPDPTIQCIMDGVKAMEDFEPDTVIAFGGGSPMDASKIMRL